MNIEYDLSSINGYKTSDILNEIHNNNNGNNSNNCNDNNGNIKNTILINKPWIRNNKVYNILKYEKKLLAYDMIDGAGLWRSVICSNKKIDIFSPPKTEHINMFMCKYKEEECIAQEFIEGTMINVFYDKDIGKWEIASKSSIGAVVTFFQDQPTFSELFYDICTALDINFDDFSKDYCYSFVMQHPQNRFVIPIVEKRLYLIAMYKIENFKITELSLENYTFAKSILEKIKFPRNHKFSSYNELLEQYASMNTDINIMGIMIKHKDGKRTKIRNPNYEYIRHLRGNNTKLQYQYLCLRKLDKVKEYIKYFPGNRKLLGVFRNQVHTFTNDLYKNYIKCYIKKEKPLKEFSVQFRTHMFNLHQYYLSIRYCNGYINKIIVIDYINKLEPARLMYALNYHLHTAGKLLEINKMEVNKMEVNKMEVNKMEVNKMDTSTSI